MWTILAAAFDAAELADQLPAEENPAPPRNDFSGARP